MSATRKPLDFSAMALMTALCLTWGMQQVAVKVAAPGMGPVMQLGVRSLVAALLVCGWIWLRGLGQGDGTPLPRGTFWPGMGAGALFAGEFFCISFGLQFTTASHMSVFLYTAPVFTVLGMHWLVAGERLGRLQWAGVLVSFAGIALAFSEGFTATGREWRDLVTGDALGLLGGLFWGATTVLIRRSALSEAPAALTLLYQLVSAGILLILIAALMGQASGIAMTGMVWTSLFFQSVIIAFASYLIWFWMLRHYLASRLSVFSFMTPLFGVCFGVLLLNEPVGARFATGATLVMAGVVMVNLRGR